jgi:hypothetical protein
MPLYLRCFRAKFGSSIPIVFLRFKHCIVDLAVSQKKRWGWQHQPAPLEFYRNRDSVIEGAELAIDNA